MANIASLLKNEIARVARKAARGETTSLKKAVGGYRGEIAALKRRVLALEAELRRLGKAAARTAAAPAADTAAPALPRFSPKSLAAQRRRLGLSVHDCALLIGASGQSVYNWEDGKARPRAKHLLALASLRRMGRRDVAARLGELRA